MKETNEYAGAPSSELIWFPYKWLHGIQFQKHSDNADYALGEFDMILNRFKNWPQDFAADLPPAPAGFMAHAQMLTAANVFTTPVTKPAWKIKPSWYLVAKDDKVINPDPERLYAERAHSHKVEAEAASHAVYISHAKEVAALIEDAAGQARVAGSH